MNLAARRAWLKKMKENTKKEFADSGTATMTLQLKAYAVLSGTRKKL